MEKASVPHSPRHHPAVSSQNSLSALPPQCPRILEPYPSALTETLQTYYCHLSVLKWLIKSKVKSTHNNTTAQLAHIWHCELHHYGKKARLHMYTGNHLFNKTTIWVTS
ncbi:hypothetical protein KC19_VG319700 [Ceratodon purpureus]|uniref:Uncharacterized protein n=1 Tax=Ceratodon purpureus TaxID=3225 RepID=A0A8T0HWR4_CERPU|nr:hypothetical protein KC19_VG319700 [Ceratodon purpureus]